jgi:hypothetical protein
MKDPYEHYTLAILRVSPILENQCCSEICAILHDENSLWAFGQSRLNEILKVIQGRRHGDGS